jgi:hypothetical protein
VSKDKSAKCRTMRKKEVRIECRERTNNPAEDMDGFIVSED